MQFIPVKTRILTPPQDDLFAVLDESLRDIEEGDVVLVSSKIVAIHEGRCISTEDADKVKMVEEESTLLIPRPYWGTPLSITHNAFIGAAGIDESNADGYYILLPKDPFKSAETIWHYVRKRFDIKNVGVVITDSHSTPLRYGAVGISIGFWGFVPLADHIGKEDLFGREMKIERSNVVDGLASGASVVMGEVAEQTPVVIARDIPDLVYSNKNEKDTLFSPLEDDTFRVLYEQWMSPKNDE